MSAPPDRGGSDEISITEGSQRAHTPAHEPSRAPPPPPPPPANSLACMLKLPQAPNTSLLMSPCTLKNLTNGPVETETTRCQVHRLECTSASSVPLADKESNFRASEAVMVEGSSVNLLAISTLSADSPLMNRYLALPTAMSCRDLAVVEVRVAECPDVSMQTGVSTQLQSIDAFSVRQSSHTSSSVASALPRVAMKAQPTPKARGTTTSLSAQATAQSRAGKSHLVRASVIATDSGAAAPPNDRDDGNSLGEDSFGSVHDGMRREWNFSLSFVHESARVRLQISPQWVQKFVDVADMQPQLHLDRDVKHCPLSPVLTYTDVSAVMGGGDVPKKQPPGSHKESEPDASLSGDAEEDGAQALGDDLWLEKAKTVQLCYSHIPPDMTLANFCIVCVQHILKDPDVISVDDDTALRKLRLGHKLTCPYRLGGRYRSFHFSFALCNKSNLMNDSAYAIGTIVNQRGYLLIARCLDETELDGYVQKLFLPHYTNPAKVLFDHDLTYGDISSLLLSDQQATYGELCFEDRDAALSFSLPMYPMRFRPDFSPAKTVGVGSITCMTLEISVHERLFDDTTVAEVTGVPKYKVNSIVLCIDVEDVARMGYPNILATEQYSELKIKRLLEVFPDAKLIGQPTTILLGGRAGRSYTATFVYEPMQCVVKAMVVSTLVGSRGVTALYLSRLGGGGFDMYLYLYQQLLRSVCYLEQNALRIDFDRREVVNVRLMDSDLLHLYGTTEDDQRELEIHRKLLKESNDGKAIGATYLSIPVEEGGVGASFFRSSSRSRNLPESMGGDDESTGVSSHRRRSINMHSSRMSNASTPEGYRVASQGRSDSVDETEEDDLWERLSLHSQSLISVSAIPRLQDSLDDEDDDDDDDAIPLAAMALTTAAGSSTAREDVATPPPRSMTPRDLNTAAPNHGTGGTILKPCTGRNGFGIQSARSSLLLRQGNSFSRQSSTSGIRSNSLPIGRPTNTCISTPCLSPPTTGIVSQLTESMHRPSGESLVAGEPAASGTEDVTAGPASLTMEAATYHQVVEGALEKVSAYQHVPSLRDVYVRCCDLQHCRPNSYLLTKLPTDPRFTHRVEEIDLTANYLGHNGFVTMLSLLEHLTALRGVYFNKMGLENIDAQNMCEALANVPTLTSVYVEDNPKITLPATKFFTRMLNRNRSIKKISLVGTGLGESVQHKLEQQAQENQDAEQ